MPYRAGLPPVSGIIFDELPAQPNRELWDVLRTAVGSRRQPITFVITTAGYDCNSICWEMHDYAVKGRDDIIDDPSLLPVIYAAPEDLDWRSDEALQMANPGLGVTVKREYLEEERAKAVETPGYQNTFRRLHLGRWTEQESRWLYMRVWGENGMAPGELVGRHCYAGLDLSSMTDLTSLVLVFPDGADYAVLPFFWVPEGNLRQRVQRDRVPYDAWVRDGHLEATDGEVVDYQFIRERIRELSLEYDIWEILVDRWNSMGLQMQLMGDGFPIVPFGQGFASMSAPAKELERALLDRCVRHGNHPVLTWNAGNVAVKQDAAGNVKPAKDKSTDRIDGIVALIMGIAGCMRHQGEARSVYEEREIFVI